MNNPFPKLMAEAHDNPEDKRLREELAAYLTSLAIKGHSKRYGIYEVLETQNFEKEN